MADTERPYEYKSVPPVHTVPLDEPSPVIADAPRDLYERKRRHILLHLWEWKWEIATWMLSTAAMISMIAVLAFFKDQPISTWTARFQLSTAVAALAQIAQSALMVSISSCIGQLKWPWLKSRRPDRPATTMAIDQFDWATRGPYGSLLLLLRMKRPHLVHLGALVTVIMLAFTTFAQQSVTTTLRKDVHDTTNAVIGRSLSFSPLLGETMFLPEVASEPRRVDAGLESAMNLGMISDLVTPSDVLATCSGDLCTWSHYQTLGLCSSAVELDAKDIITKTGNSSVRFSISKFVQGEPKMLAWAPVIKGAFRSMWMTTNINRTYNPTHEDRTPPVSWSWDVYMAYFSPCNDIDTQYTMPSQWKAYKGSLEFCIQTLDTVHNSSTQTTVVEEKRNLKWPKAGEGCIKQGNDTFCQNGFLGQKFSERFSGAFNGSAALQRNATNPYYPSVSEGIGHYYTGAFSSNFMYDCLGKNVTACKDDPKLGFAGFERRMSNLANALTNQLRTRDSTTAVTGTTFKVQQFFSVEFWWLTLPIALYICSSILLFCTIIVSGEGSIPLWKSSNIVLLHIMDRNNRLGYIHEVMQEAERDRVEFVDTGENWHLKRKVE
ncbi:hypothetical protein P154DRAFT_561786 [Amniculicola lignicola CBS 123094]|uniref:Uncharacterized protein n=1 Tax=Amniculicola lignicola CBS 123094 TaxID=1392246 RepID=A0A6A5WYI0_9PLEO|nr:hypothetical protein P154DRAFT_561786 [Amniculicola lignicola CBS 123094]